jgi:hypothetical protein
MADKQPVCGKCGGARFTWTTKSFGGIIGMLVFCEDCAAVITWQPKPQK